MRFGAVDFSNGAIDFSQEAAGRGSERLIRAAGKIERMTQTPPPARVAVVTGAAQGIGRRAAEVLADNGFAVVLSDINAPDATRASIERLGGRAIEAVGDLTNADALSVLVAAVAVAFGRVDVLVNNAGVSLIRPAQETSVDELRRVLEVNLVAPFLLAQAFGKVMLTQRLGSIVNVASIAGLFAVADRVAYNVSKHALIGMTRTLAAEWGGFGVRCNAVCPGWVKTEMDVADQTSGNYRDDDIVNRVPMGRFASPEDIAQAILFLSDPSRSGFVNGQTIVVDGGWTTDATWESLRLKHRP
jgi:NAD(P)-dependent dehydrogenase (short-subunit alcohol dehydrogenase family)